MWANGNGGPRDDCGADGYSTSMYTISVGAVGVTGEASYYDEECSAKMATAYVTDDEGYSAVVSVFSVSVLRKYGYLYTIQRHYNHVHSSIIIKCKLLL